VPRRTNANANTNTNTHTHTHAYAYAIGDTMKHTIVALLVAVIAIVVVGVLVAGATSSSVDKVGEPRQEIEAPSGVRQDTDLADASTSVTSADVSGITDPTTLVSAAATTTLVQAGAGEIAPGASITVPVTAENVAADSPLAAATIEIRYDPSVLDATACDVDPNAMFDSAICNPNFDNDAIDPDAARFSVTSVSGVSGNLPLANITFAAIGQSGDTSVVDVVIAVFADPAGNPVPAIAQGGQICLTPCASTDSDGDGYTDAKEAFMGTDPLLACSIDSIPDNEDPDAWPPDFNDDQAVNILDVFRLTPPVFNSSPPDPDYSQRKDLNADGTINIVDIFRLTPPVFNTSCTP
jgi:uncharacterized cupredoxin-like copper-binding protein